MNGMGTSGIGPSFWRLLGFKQLAVSSRGFAGLGRLLAEQALWTKILCHFDPDRIALGQLAEIRAYMARTRQNYGYDARTPKFLLGDAGSKPAAATYPLVLHRLWCWGIGSYARPERGLKRARSSLPCSIPSFGGSMTNAKEVMAALDDFFADSSVLEAERNKAWAMLCALRGPDNGDNGLKKSTTAVLRALFFPKTSGSAGYILGDVSLSGTLQDVEDMVQGAGTHFGRHCLYAIRAFRGEDRIYRQ